MNPKLDPLVAEYCRTKNKALKGEIIEKYRPLIEYISRRLAFNKDDVDDLIQVGCIATFKALDRFDVTKNTEFSTFATPNIIGEIKHYFRDKSKILKVPRKLQELYTKIKSEISKAQQQGISLTVADLAIKLDVDEEKIIESMEASQNNRLISLDSPSYKSEGLKSAGNETTLLDQIGTNDTSEIVINKETLKQSILKLNSRERRIVYLRFYGGLSQSEIAQRLELSQMHISRLLARAIRKLQTDMKRQP